MIVRPEVASLAVEVAVRHRERVKGARIEAGKVTLFALPEENDLTREMVLKVHGKGFAQRIVHVSPKERLGGLFEQEREPEQFREVAEGDDWLLVWERDLPDWAVARVLMDFEEGEREVA